MNRKYYVLSFLVSLVLVFSPSPVAAQTCGNGVCELLETCLTCSSDCTSCVNVQNIVNPVTTILPSPLQQIIPQVLPSIPVPTVQIEDNTINLFPNSSNTSNNEDNNQNTNPQTPSTRTETTTTNTRSQDIFIPPQQVPVSATRQTIIAREEDSIVVQKKQGKEGYINLQSEDTEIIFTPEVFAGSVTEWYIIYPQADINVIFNFAAMLKTGAQGNEVLLPKKITIIKPLGEDKISFAFPANTIMRANNIQTNIPWDGLFYGPTFLSPAETCTNNEEEEFAIHIGRDDLQVTFTNPVAMQIPHRGNQKVSYCFDKKVEKVNRYCSEEYTNECYKNENNNLIVETHHFTQFLVAKKTVNYLPFILIVIGIIIIIIILSLLYKFSKRKKNPSPDDQKNSDIDTTVHELKTPLTAIMGFAKMILHGTFGPISPTVKKPLTTIVSSGTRLTTMINDMLNFSRLKSGKLSVKLSSVELSPVVENVVDHLSPLVKEKKIALKIEHMKDMVILADEEKLKQVLINLIGNAIKFTEKGSIHVSAQKKDQHVLLSVKDTGVGISPDDQKNLFTKFERGSTEAKESGTGLGLYISRELIRKMNGDIWVEESHVGKGTTISLSLPISESKHA